MSRATSAELARFNRVARSVLFQESGYRWDAVGPDTGGGDRAYGIGQVMNYNVGPWTQQYYGRRLSPSEYLNNREAQIAVINGVFQNYFSQAQSRSRETEVQVRMVAAAWFGGPGNMNNWNSISVSDGYMNMRDYTASAWRAYQRDIGADPGGSEPKPPDKPDEQQPITVAPPTRPTPDVETSKERVESSHESMAGTFYWRNWNNKGRKINRGKP